MDVNGEEIEYIFTEVLTAEVEDDEEDFDEEYINLNAILVGNGVMSFEDNSLDKSEI